MVSWETVYIDLVGPYIVKANSATIESSIPRPLRIQPLVGLRLVRYQIRKVLESVKSLIASG